MKRKRSYGKQKKSLQNDAAVVAEKNVMNDETQEPETSMRCPPLRKSLSNKRTEENITSRHMEIETPRTGLERGKTVHGRVENHPNALSELVATIIKEISKEVGGLSNLSRSLVDNPISNGQMGQSHADMNLAENESPLHQNPEYKQQELNAALKVIKETMKLDEADPFNRPVDPVALEIPDYLDVIDTPVDFGTICDNLENGLKYMNSADVLKDVEYIWYNCQKYNKKGDYILELMKRVKTYFTKCWISCGLHIEQSSAINESSILRHNNRQKDYPRAPLANNLTQLQHNEAGSNQVAENRSGPVNLQPGQPHQSSSPPQSSPEQDEYNIDSTIIQKKIRVRGRTRCTKLLKTVGRIKIVTNELGHPVGPEASRLTSFLGVTARDGNLAPLTYPTWREVPEENKENMWQKVLTKFDIDPCYRDWVLTSLKSKWRNFKFHLKVTHYDAHETDEERLADRDVRVLPEQWSVLVSQWSSEKWQSISARNKANRAKLKFSHTTGKKSFARLLEEEKAKRPDGQEPSRAELFILTRTRKNGQPVNEETAAVISQLRESTTQNEETSINTNGSQDDAYKRVMGLDRKRDVAPYGLNAIYSSIPTRAEALKMVKEKSAEVVEMKERLASVEQTCSQMVAQMSAMVSMMATMQKNPPTENLPNAVKDTLVPVGIQNQSEPTCTSIHKVPPAKQTRGRKKQQGHFKDSGKAI